jgi:hypothetical protein
MTHNTVETYFQVGRGTSGITEELAYNFYGDLPIISATSDKFSVFDYISYEHARDKNIIIEKPAILIVRVGKAGKTQIVKYSKYIITENVLYLQPKKEFEKDFNLKWVEQYLAKKLERHSRGELTGQRNISAEIIYRINFKKIDKCIQDEIATLINISEKIKQTIVDTIIQYQSLLRINHSNHGEEKEINIIFNILGGNSDLTEEFIYHNLPDNDDDKIEILTGATLEISAMGFVSKKAKPNNKKLKIFEGPAILVVRKGIAGKMTYIPKGSFTTNDDAYALTPKKAWKDKINLEWFINEYQNLFFKIVTSKSDNATFSKEYAERQIIQLPHIDEQNRIIQKLASVKNLIQKLNEMENKIDRLLEYTVI